MEQSVWQRVHEQLDPLLLRPKARPDIVVRRLESSDRRPYYMAKSPRAGTYVRLTEREHQLLELMDGSRTVKQIVLADFAAHKSLAYNRVIQLVFLLQAQSFLVSSWVPTYALVRQRLRAPRGLRARATRVADFLFGRELAITGIDPLITALYRSVGWALLALLDARPLRRRRHRRPAGLRARAGRDRAAHPLPDGRWLARGRPGLRGCSWS